MSVHFFDLPDEMLLAICKKLKSVDVLYSLLNVDERLDQLVLDPAHTRHLDFFDCPCSIMDRICTQILPRISRLVFELTLELHKMEQILLATEYPSLHSLSIFTFEQKALLPHLKGTVQH